jgi:hypothetical protein
VIGTNATQLALWDFNSNPPDTNTATGVTTPSVGSGTAAVVGGLPSAFNQGADADPASLGSDNSSWDITKGPPQGTGNKTAGVQFDISTADYTNIVIAWEQRVSALASKYYRFQYTTNGSAFIDGPVISMQDTNLFLFQTVDLSGVPGVADNTNFGFRVVAEFQSTAANTTNNNYVTTSTNAYATSGTMRFDMVNTFGDLIVRQPPVIHSLTGAGKGSITLTWGSISGLTYRVQYTFQLNPTAWTNLTPDITATNPVSFMLDNPGAASRRFYRVLLLQ